MNEAEAFLAQNPLCAEGLTVEQIEDHTAPHSGGLVVLLRGLGDGVLVKMHDSWGGDEEIVVHRYDPDEAEPQTSEIETVWVFAGSGSRATDAAEAFKFFEEL